jgi:hypothetical protein
MSFQKIAAFGAFERDPEYAAESWRYVPHVDGTEVETAGDSLAREEEGGVHLRNRREVSVGSTRLSLTHDGTSEPAAASEALREPDDEGRIRIASERPRLFSFENRADSGKPSQQAADLGSGRIVAWFAKNMIAEPPDPRREPSIRSRRPKHRDR